MRINTNVTALNTYNRLNAATNAQSKSMEKLSSGLRINSAADDAAGLSISEKMRGQIRGLDQASRNAQDGISLISTAEGALNETQSILQRMRELATQSANDTNTSTDRQNIQKEVDQLATEITRISNTTEFNKQTLLNGGIKQGAIGVDSLQIGANTGQTMSIDINAMDAKSLGVSGDATTATIAAGANNISAVSLNGVTGSLVTPGATLTATVSTTAANTTWSAVDLGITGTSLSSTAQSSQYNGYKITVTKTAAAGSDVSAAIDTAAKTITINYSSDVAAAGSTAAKLNTAFANAGIGLTATGDATAVAGATNVAATTAGLAANEAKVTLSNGAGGIESTIISNTATSASFSDPTKFAGVQINFTSAPTATTTGTINIAKTLSTSATFANGKKTADAVAAAGIDVSSSAGAASNALTTIDNAIQSVSAERAKLGAFQNRLDHTINNLGTSSENLTAAESRIRDVDMAKEIMNNTKNSILSQASQAMLAQANQLPQGVLQLLR